MYTIFDAMRDYDKVNWRYLIYPEQKLPGENFINRLVPLVNSESIIKLGFQERAS